MKLKLEVEEIISRINNQIVFEAETADGSAYIKIEDYVPFVCFAIHDGHRVRPELLPNLTLNEQERWYEEDPHTYEFISSLPLVKAGIDSRYEYDLNRSPLEAIYQKAWGKVVWVSPLGEDEKEISLEKHHHFYRIVHALIQKLESLYSAVLVFDIHSYNYKRIDRDTPVFNIGTALVTQKRFRKYITHWKKELKKIELPSIEVTVTENDVFHGRGYLAEYLTTHFSNTLVLPTEVKKIYCNEETGEIYPQIIEKLSSQLKRAIVSTAALFTRTQTSFKLIKNNALLSSELDRDIIRLDRQLFELARNFEILNYVNPVNIEQAKREFYRSKYAKNPRFMYRQLALNPFDFKRALYQLPIEKINDISLRLLYQDVIDSYADKVDIIGNIGSSKFLYNSLRYFGEPETIDIKNAEYLLHCSASPDGDETMSMTAQEVYHHFEKITADYGFQCKIEISRQIISTVQILNNRKTIRIRRDAKFSETNLRALAEHEIGVHMLTTINSRLQPLQIFRLGTPVNTHTQEGLAILSEYLSGNLSVQRLQVIALRVLAINMMLKGHEFRQTFHFLRDSGLMTDDQAFYLTARIYRGGGFTKDYLYLKGFKDILNRYMAGESIHNLLIGKTSVKYLPVINEMIERKILLPPKHITRSFKEPATANPVISYLLEGLYATEPKLYKNGSESNFLPRQSSLETEGEAVV